MARASRATCRFSSGNTQDFCAAFPDRVTGAAVNWFFYFFLCLFRDDGLSNSQAHIALNDHTSLFHETKERLDGTFLIHHLWFSLTPVVIMTISTFPLRLCVDCDSDSDSDLSLEDDQSGSYASTHSSDSEDEEGPLPPEECWENLASHVGKRPQPQGTDVHMIPAPVCASHVLSLHSTHTF